MKGDNDFQKLASLKAKLHIQWNVLRRMNEKKWNFKQWLFGTQAEWHMWLCMSDWLHGPWFMIHNDK